MQTDADVVVAGGGPAGAAAAIWCALSGLRVILVERDQRPRPRPGETLHPGVEVPLAQLGVAEYLTAGELPRHAGHWVCRDGRSWFVPFGGDGRGQWRGFQIARPALDGLLLGRARAVGVDVRAGVSVRRPLLSAGRVVGLDTADGRIGSRLTLDASGSAHWLARRLGLGVRRHSPRLTATYGYAEHATRDEFDERRDAPVFTTGRHGWTWTARVGQGVHHWTRLRLAQGRPQMEPPTSVAALRPLGRPRGADVTWRLVDRLAGPGYLVLGDAAAVLDPASSHGVLRALLSGMQAAHLATAVHHRPSLEAQAAAEHTRWLRAWFAHDAENLRASYRGLSEPPAWVGEGP